tara:strand:+ start:875 stop:1126 length:252 start_codon:yes stop_codon:yes gene_type:complete
LGGAASVSEILFIEYLDENSSAEMGLGDGTEVGVGIVSGVIKSIDLIEKIDKPRATQTRKTVENTKILKFTVILFFIISKSRK